MKESIIIETAKRESKICSMCLDNNGTPRTDCTECECRGKFNGFIQGAKHMESHAFDEMLKMYEEWIKNVEIAKQIATAKERTRVGKIAREAFCLLKCDGHPHRDTCTSLGTCDEYDKFCKIMRELKE